ncbi:unnamed protein product [Ectocarpus sp. CCAP 1310/34]|nr:unnamed protein product [Ectocarpus sp. CCAP 1310/34]
MFQERPCTWGIVYCCSLSFPRSSNTFAHNTVPEHLGVTECGVLQQRRWRCRCSS